MNLALIGLDAPASERHVQAILATPGIDLAAVASLDRGLDGVPWYPTLEALLANEPGVDAVAFCSSPPIRQEQATLALQAGRHVMLANPPHATLTGLGNLLKIARQAHLTLLAAWPAQFGAAVQPARALVAAHGASAVRIDWGGASALQPSGGVPTWCPGGLGVFGGGMDALSLLARLVPERLAVTAATLWFAPGHATRPNGPAAAEMTLIGSSGLVAQVRLDGRRGTRAQSDMAIETGGGTLLLGNGGTTLRRGGQLVALGPSLPYRSLYQHFRQLIATGSCDLDVTPLMQVADAHLLAQRVETERFSDGDAHKDD